MRLGTDAVLLGAFVPKELKPNRILDIGTGTGVLALMMAQKFDAQIVAVEIEAGAVKDASLNFEQSKWSNRISLIHKSILDVEFGVGFDLIVSNPPFFSSMHPMELGRQTARQQTTLNLDQLFRVVSKNLMPDGAFYIVYPYQDLELLMKIGAENGLFPRHEITIKSTEKKPAKRVILGFSKIEAEQILKETLVIHKQSRVYTKAYFELTKDFYLDIPFAE